ncbi:MAG: aspartate--ammonia ligase [Bacilli bacterium]|nr:aspartate--ammonia ligase [Bacilli bacterium]
MYQSKLDLIETQRAIKIVKDFFENALAKNLNLIRVSAPLFVYTKSGLNDDLNGIEKPVSFYFNHEDVSIVQSLAKWKRMALKDYHFEVGMGLYTDMNAIRKDETVDHIHSIYVDQWDWEKVITKDDRNLNFLKSTVKQIFNALKETEKLITTIYPSLDNYFGDEIYFISSSDLKDKFPSLTAKEREHAICKEHKCVFIYQIGGKLRNCDEVHDLRAPDYDDWELNGDILVYYPPLNRSVELSSMGIRVDQNSLLKQLKEKDALNRTSLPFHKALLNNELPLTIGGGIGQSRLCLVMLNKIHIGEVQSSLWDEKTIEECQNLNIKLL